MCFEAADKMGGRTCLISYEEDPKEVVDAYGEQQRNGMSFVHIRRKRPSNRDLRAMQHLMGSSKLYSVKLKTRGSKATGIGVEAESVVTNSESLVKAIEKTNCQSCEDIDSAVNKEAKKRDWDSIQSRFEQHMKEEDEVRADWRSGKFEERKMMACET